MSAHLGEDYKPLKPSATIKELSEMCFGGQQVDHAAPVRILRSLVELEQWLTENPHLSARVIPTVQKGNGEFGNALGHIAELAEALGSIMDEVSPFALSWESRKAAYDAIKKYKQSRGDV